MCPYCRSRDFVRTDSRKTQGELMAEVIARDSKLLKQHIEDEVGDESEGKKYERKFGVKVI